MRTLPWEAGLANKPVLCLGHGDYVEVAQSYGFSEVVTVPQLLRQAS